ncbi:MAG TPA: gluconate 2-dehydrogenase subunit 3 family protein [Steroidobacteraceae bacterium]|nr:gluconate 2-dehydrogenase subunit 3 family protein [Steroidobacteraceae bacterium]
MGCPALYLRDNATAMEIVMSDVNEDSGPLRHFRVGRRAVLQSLATGVGAAVFASQATAAAAHAHHAAATAATPAGAATTTSAESALLFLDRHAFDTLTILSEQIVPGSRAAQVSEFLDRLLAVESTDTQKRFTQALGTFEREAREAHGIPWKTLTAEQATALLTKISTQPDSDASRHAFDNIKGAVAETFYSTEVGMKELGWNGGVAFAPPSVCG